MTATCGCMPIGMTALGVGGNAAISHTLGGITYRTFTAPSRQVKTAILAALQRMDIHLVSTTNSADIEVLRASTLGRDIEIQIDPISSRATRMRVVARSNGIFFDSATAAEIIVQTEQVLEKQSNPKASLEALF